MYNDIFHQILETNMMIQAIPIIILIHVTLGTLAAIKNKKFSFEKFSNFMISGTYCTLFVVITDYFYTVAQMSNLNDFVLTLMNTFRGLVWGAVILYYGANIYKSLVKLGMPRLQLVEREYQMKYKDESEEE